MFEKGINNSEKIKDKFEQGELESVIFDLDSTLVDTGKYYRDWMKDSTRAFLEESGIEYEETDIHQIYMYGVQIHRDAGQPLLITSYVIGGIIQYLKERGREDIEKVTPYIEQYLSEFYKNSPEIEDGTLEVLYELKQKGIIFGIYSHAQQDWTEIKIRKIQLEYFDRYHEEIEIPFFTTAIDMKKDCQGWIDASNFFGFNLEKTLVVGDSMNSDIEPAKEAGCTNLVHISINEQYSNDKMVTGIKGIKQLLEHL